MYYLIVLQKHYLNFLEDSVGVMRFFLNRIFERLMGFNQ